MAGQRTDLMVEEWSVLISGIKGTDFTKQTEIESKTIPFAIA